MKRHFISIAALFLISCVMIGCGKTAATEQEENTMTPEPQTTFALNTDTSEYLFKNDLGITGIGDPYVLKTDQGYYMYCTSAADGYYCWHSDDLVNWTDKKMCYTKTEDSWCVESFWAPEVVFENGTYYMYYTAKNKDGGLRIGLATSDKPDGPFTDPVNQPLFDFGYSAIDANILIDDDGKKYMYYSRDCSENIVDHVRTSQIYGVELTSDMTALAGEPVLLLTPEQDWEKVSESPLWNEGPEIIKHNGTYYLTYSANFYASISYSVGYATSASPLGEFIKAEENPILTSGFRQDVSGPGHHSFTVSPDGSQLWIAYHSHSNPLSPSGDRKVNIDRAVFTDDGKLFMCGPNTVSQPLPSGNVISDITTAFTCSTDSGLTDGIHTTNKNQKDHETVLTPDETGKVTVSLTSPDVQTISAVAVWPGVKALSNIQSISLILDNQKCSDEKMIDADVSGPVMLTFDPCEASSVQVVLTVKENISEISLSEIGIYLKK